jgi:hypothetical protein
MLQDKPGIFEGRLAPPVILSAISRFMLEAYPLGRGSVNRCKGSDEKKFSRIVLDFRARG